MNNWKTTAGGIGAGLSMIGAGVKLVSSGDYANGVASIAGGVALIFALYNASDKGK